MNRTLLAGSLLILTLSCGKDATKRTVEAPPKKTVNKLVYDRNSYLAELKVLNKSAAGPVSGNANFKIHNDTFFAYVRLFNSIPNLVHEQRYYEAESCPGPEADTNGDGFIDILEANAVLGDPIFPLDADISSETAGLNLFPSGDQSGSYWYEQEIAYEELRQELNLSERVPDSAFSKLTDGRDLKLNSGIVLILGAPAWSKLPETVASSGGYANFQTLPIACGALRRIYVVPGEVKGDDGVTLPNGEVGGSRGQYDDVPVLFPLPKDAKDYGDDDQTFP